MSAPFQYTLLTAAEPEGKTACKRIVGKSDGSFESFSYDNVLRWRMQEVEARNHHVLARHLQVLAARTSSMIVMGKPVAGLDLRKPQLRRFGQGADGITLCDAPRRYVVIDVDDYTLPTPFGLAEHLPDAAKAVRDDALPEAFAGVSAVVAATSSTGLVGEGLARLRVIFELIASHPLADLRKWATGAQACGIPLDAAVISCGQPIYTARPRFEGALRGKDPVPPALRAFVLPGTSSAVDLDLHQFDRQAETIAREVRRSTERCGDDWRAFLNHAVGGPASFFLPLSRGIGLAVRSVHRTPRCSASSLSCVPPGPIPSGNSNMARAGQPRPSADSGSGMRWRAPTSRPGAALCSRRADHERWQR